MGREIGVLPGFFLGVLVGSAATSFFFCYARSSPRDDCKSIVGASEDSIQEDSNEHEVQRDDQQRFEAALNDTNGHHQRGSSSLLQGQQHRRLDSNGDASTSSTTSVSVRRSFTLDTDEVSMTSSSSKTRNYAENPSRGANCQVITREDWESDDLLIRQAKEFEEQILNKLKDTQEMEMALRRTRAINALAHTLTAAKDEMSCFEVVSRLIVPLFRIDGCAYLMTKTPETLIIKHVTVSKQEYAIQLGLIREVDDEIPINRSAAAICAKTMKQEYTPKTSESPYPGQREITYKAGMNTQLMTPIIINGDKFAGCIVCCMEREDGFNEIDRMLVDNVAHMLAASIYSKRLRLAAESSNKVSREMLHSLIPAKVIEKIECFWDENTAEYQSRRSSSFIASQCSSIDDSDRDYNFDDNEFDLFDEGISSNKPTSAKEQQENKMERTKLRRQSIRQSIKNKIGLLNEMNRDEPADHVGVVIDTSAMELSSTHRALYAETVPNVCIIFTDIVRFSQISLGMKPIKVMDMLQDLFSRFDALCDRYGIQKLETIGDAFICTSPMFDENADKDHQQVALNALEMAKEMVKEARRVIVPKKGAMQTLEIRVGIHIGDLTCGVLGERLPKFTVFGSSVNLAARMEQACLPSRIRMTKDFYDLLPESESEVVEAREIIRAKNMGEVETYLLNPLLERGTNTLHTHWEEMGGSACSLYD